MKKELLLWCMMLVVLSGCAASQWKDREYSFAEGFSDLYAIDQEFNGSFKDERLNVMMVSFENIDPLLVRLDEAKENMQLTKESQEKEALLEFIEIRKLMLLAEKNFQLAQRIGDIGLVTDEGGFKCAEAKYILDATFYYNESWSFARQVQFDLDLLLHNYRDVPQLQDLVGLNEKRASFYFSPLDHIKTIINLNREALENNCKIRVVTI